MNAPVQPIAIVGGGFSGAITAVQLLRQAPGTVSQILLIERQAYPGRGLAYRTQDDNFVLNVPAGNMSALADVPQHFVDYCQTIDPAFNATSFVSRRIYGNYLEHTLQQAAAQSPVRLERIRGEVTAVVPTGAGYELTLAEGDTYQAKRVVLALGHGVPLNPPPFDEEISGYVRDPWSAALDRIDTFSPVLLLGMGHTAIDTVFRLTSHGDGRKVYVLSRRGRLPQGHRSSPKPPAHAGFPPYLAAATGLRQYLRAIRGEVADRLADGGDWRDVLNGLRPYTPELWQRLSLIERQRFMRHLQPFWDTHRHRLAPVAHHRLHQLIERGQVVPLAGRVLGYVERNGLIEVRIKLRQQAQPTSQSVRWVVNCAGPNYRIHRSRSALWRQLLASGQVQADDLQLGLQINAHYQVVDAQGGVGGLYYLGPMLRANYWEAVAVPELRGHAQRLAALLAE